MPGHCPRCGAHLAWRHEGSIERTWALLIAAAILYVPANLLPVLTTYTVATAQTDTIMSGVIFLYTSGSWPLALIVLVASVMIPISKIAALGYVLVSVRRGSAVSGPARWLPSSAANAPSPSVSGNAVSNRLSPGWTDLISPAASP